MQNRYLLRVAIKPLGVDPIAGLETSTEFNLGEVRISIGKRDRYLVFTVADFATQNEALNFLPHLEAGLWNLALEYNIAFVPDFTIREITRPEDPEVAGKNLAKNFGLPELGLVHGLADEGGSTTYRSDEKIVFLGIGEPTAHVSTHLKDVIRVLGEGIERADTNVVLEDEKLMTAIDLYLGQFYERSIRARFLTLVMTLEVLSPVTEKHAIVQKIIGDWKTEIQEKIENTKDADERDALIALNRELEFRKETSIRRRVRRLILDVIPLDHQSKHELAKSVVWAYDLRGSLVHSGTVDESQLHEAFDIVFRAVKLLLRARLGLPVA